MLTFRYNTTDSTNTRAAVLAAMNPGRPLLVSAHAQTAGRGRTGRRWQSPVGGAWFSLALPADRAFQNVQAAPLIAGLAVHETLCDLLGGHDADALRIKWPNDLLLHGRKIAGILCEQHLTARPAIIVGVGINANVDPASLDPRNLRRPAASLADRVGCRVDVRRLVDHAAARICAEFDGLARRGLDVDTRMRLRRRLAWLGDPVRVRHQHVNLIGRVIGIDRRGRLTLATDHGPFACVAGEIEQLEPVSSETAPMP